MDPNPPLNRLGLKQNKLVSNDQKIDLVKEHIFPTYYIDGELRDKINALDNERIQLFHTTDTMYGMHFMLKGER